MTRPQPKLSPLGDTRHIRLPVTSPSNSDRVVDVVDEWVSECVEAIDSTFLSERGRVDFRLFYSDSIYDDLMFRFIIRHGQDGSLSREIVLAGVTVRNEHQKKGHFRRLLQGLEQFATRIGADLEVESASSKLSRTLFDLGYLRSEDRALPKVWTKLSGCWKYNPQRESVMALIELPSGIIPDRHRSDIGDKITSILNEELALFVARTSKRIKDET